MVNHKFLSINYPLLAIFIAYLLDLILGDPQISWHPVRLIGKLIEKLERILNTNNINRKFSGIILIILVVGTTIFCVWGVLLLANLIHPLFYYSVWMLLIYFALSTKSLACEANKVYQVLKNGDIKNARKNLSMIVARDTDKLEQSEIIRATVETVAESIMDGIIAPLFYIFLGGPILVWAYKAINTLDSMVGYRSERFIDFGSFAAKIDGFINFIPAKLTCFTILISSFCYKKDWIASGKWFLKYFLKGSQYNSEATEAVMAGALKVQLGGLNFYNSIPLEKTLIGDGLYPLKTKHIKESIEISYVSSAIFMITGLILFWLWKRG